MLKGPGYVTTAVIVFAGAGCRGWTTEGVATGLSGHGRGDHVMSTTKDVREAAEAEPGSAPLAGPADISARDMGGEGGAQRHGCRRRLPRLIEVR